MPFFFNVIRIVLLTVLLIAGCSTHSSRENSSHYTVKADIDTQKKALNALVEMTYVPDKDIRADSIAFIAHENVVITKCTADNLLDYKEKKTGNKLKSIVLYFNDTIENSTTIRFEYQFKLSKEDAPWGIDKISEDWIELSLNSCWLPILSSFNNQFSADAEINIKSKHQFEILSSGSTRQLGPNKFQITNRIPQLDLVVLGSPNFDESTDRKISIYENESHPERNHFMHQIGNESLEWLNTKFGDVKHLASSKLIITPRNESGYARKNLIVLSNDISVKDTIHFANYITHEFAHFWSSGTNPLSAHRWLDESIAEYLAWKYIDERFDEKHLKKFLSHAEKEAASIPPVYIKEKDEIPIHAVMYRKGVYKLFKLEVMIGEKQMDLLLKAWFRIDEKNSENFLRQLEIISGIETSDAFRSELSQ